MAHKGNYSADATAKVIGKSKSGGSTRKKGTTKPKSKPRSGHGSDHKK